MGLRKGEHADHLGSASTATNTSGGIHSEQRYYPYGEERWSSGTLPTDYEYTSQRHEDALNLYDYRARYYDPQLGRFVQADSIIPQVTPLVPLTVNLGEFVEQVNAENQSSGLSAVNPQALNRYSYVENNPLIYTDPSGHALLAVMLTLTAVGFVTSFAGSVTSQVLLGGHGSVQDNASNIDWGDAWIAGGVGAAAGFVALFATTLVAATALGASASMATYGLTQISNDEEITVAGTLTSATVGAVFGAWGGKFDTNVTMYDPNWGGDIPKKLALKMNAQALLDVNLWAPEAFERGFTIWALDLIDYVGGVEGLVEKYQEQRENHGQSNQYE